MKTQLLEDIGENTPLPLTPPGKPGHPTTDKAAQHLSPARSAPFVSETPQPAQAAPSPDLDSVFEEIAALEAQYVAPATNHEPVLGPIEPALPAAQAEPPHQPAVAPAESTAVPDPGLGVTVPRDPVFDFTLPSPEPQAAAAFTPASGWPARPKPRRLLWGTGLLAAALLIGGGWWLYEDNSLAGSLARLADGANQALPVQKAVEPPTTASRQADGPAAPAAPESSPAAAAPPLVMLEPESRAAARAEPAAPAPAPEQAAAGTAATSGPDTQAAAAFPLPKSLSRAARGESDAPAKPAPRKVKPEPVRQLARASTVQAERPATGEGAMTALLRACREHGYHAAQCVKQGCSLTQYGFACRGR